MALADRISQLLFYCSKDLKQQTDYSLVTAQAKRSFIKQRIVHSQDVRVG